MKKEWRVVIAAVMVFLCYALAMFFSRKHGEGNGAPSVALSMEARTSTDAHARMPSYRLDPRLGQVHAGVGSETTAWDLPIAPAVWFSILAAFPDADYNPWEEGYIEFCERVPDATHLVAIDSDGKVAISLLKRTENEDGVPNCQPESVLTVETMTGSTALDARGYIVMSDQFSNIYDIGQLYRPFFEINSDDMSLGTVLAAANDWIETLRWAKAEEYDDVEDAEVKIRLMEAHLKAYDILIGGENATLLQIHPTVRSALMDESVELQEELLESMSEEE